jgi:hypothetical protein
VSQPPQRLRKRRYWVEEDSFVRDRDKITKDVRRFDELSEGMVFKIENAAEECPQVVGGPFRASACQDPDDESQIIVILFSISDDDTCHLWSVVRTTLD